jgi:hypothetical protein
MELVAGNGMVELKVLGCGKLVFNDSGTLKRALPAGMVVFTC